MLQDTVNFPGQKLDKIKTKYSVHACTCTRAHTHTHTHTHTQICIHIHTLTRSHTHAHIYSFMHMINGSVYLARCCYVSCSAPCPVLFFPFCSVVPLITICCGFEWFCMWHTHLTLAVDWEPPGNHCTCCGEWTRTACCYLLLNWTYWVGWMCELGWVMAVFCPAVSCFWTDSLWHAFNTLAKYVWTDHLLLKLLNIVKLFFSQLLPSLHGVCVQHFNCH